MKKEPKAVYIIENGGYTELTYEEFRRREQICPLYADKLLLPLYGRLMEVSKEDYTEFYQAKRRQKYLDERSADNGDFSYDMLTTDEFSGEDILIVEQPDVCDTIVESIMTDKLRKCMAVTFAHGIDQIDRRLIDGENVGRCQDTNVRRHDRLGGAAFTVAGNGHVAHHVDINDVFAEVVNRGLCGFRHPLHEFLHGNAPEIVRASHGMDHRFADAAVGAADADVFV